MSRKTIFLTGVGSVLTKEAEDKLFKEDVGIPRCDQGLTREQYQDLGIPEEKIPQSLKDKEKALEFGEEELETEEVFSTVVLPIDQMKLWIQDDGEDTYTTIFLKGGITVTVLEDAIEIDNYIDYVNRGWFEKLKDSVSFFFREIFRSKKNDITLKVE
jgi:hypothetical protein